MSKLSGRVALVTGASRGIGRVTALRLAREGADLVVNFSTDRAGGEAVAAEIRALGRRALICQADVRDRVAVHAMVAETAAALGPVDILVNNAGTLIMGRALTASAEELRAALAINVESMLHCTQAVAPGMIQRRSGRIINVSATSALGTAVTGTVPHVIAKSGVVMLTKQLALELGEHQVTVNAVCPGAIETEITSPGGRLYEQLKEVRKHQLAHTALRRIGRSDDVAAAIAFLAGPDADFITGQALSIDGGRTDFLTHSG